MSKLTRFKTKDIRKETIFHSLTKLNYVNQLLESFKRKHMEASIVIMTALMLAGAIGLAGEVIGLFLTGVDIQYEIPLAGFSIILDRVLLLFLSIALVLVLGFISFRLIVPPFAFQVDATCRLLYDNKQEKFLPGIFYLEYLVQMSAEQALRVLLKNRPELQTQINSILFSDFKEGSQASKLIEYLIYSWLKWDMGLVRYEQKTETIGIEKLPKELRENIFIDTFSALKPKDIVERSLNQVILTIPKGYRIEYSSSNGFIIKGKYCDISITYVTPSISGVGSMYSSPGIPTIFGIPVNPFFHKMLLKTLDSLLTLNSQLELRAKFHKSRLRYLMDRSEFEQYADWAIKLSDGFKRYFDMETLNERIWRKAYQEIFDILKIMENRTTNLSGISDPQDNPEE